MAQTETPSPSLLSDREFAALAEYASQEWGLHITERKRDIVNQRIRKLKRLSGARTMGEVLRVLKQEGSDEAKLEIFDALSTNHTGFFRENSHFECLRNEILRPAASARGPLRIWSAACSSGCEPYTIALLIHETLPNAGEADARILATDLSNTALGKARAGRYAEKAMADVPPHYRKQHFHQGGDRHYQIGSHLRRMVTFGRLNLMESWPMKGPFDAIFCRNVMIYFDNPTKNDLVDRLQRLLRRDGLLFIGTSETLVKRHASLDLIQPAVYRKAR